MFFFDSATASAATLIANGGAGGAAGGAISFKNTSTGGTARVEVFGNGNLDISSRDLPGITIGSIEGTGNVLEGSRTLTTGSNNLSTTLSGVIQTFPAGGGGLTKIGTGTLTLTGANTFSGPLTVNGGTLELAESLTTISSLTAANDGIVRLLPTGTGTGTHVIKTKPVTVSGTAKIDLTDNKLITSIFAGSWTGSAYTGVTGLIRSGRNGGSWDGSGIITSQTLASSGSFTSLGVASAAQAKGTAPAATSVWSGQTVTGNETLVMYTYGGDANLDGHINVDDYGRIDFNVPLGTSGWFNGDFNYDGKINVDDYGIIDFNIGIQGPAFSTSSQAGIVGLVSADFGELSRAVPEPAISGLLAAAVLLTRRRRRSAKPA